MYLRFFNKKNKILKKLLIFGYNIFRRFLKMMLVKNVKKLFFLGMSVATIAVASSCQKPVVNKTMLYGNVITLDEKGTTAEAVGVNTKTGKIFFIGTREEAKKQTDNQTKEVDYQDNYIYPGFIDAHSHPGFLGSALAGGCLCTPGDTKEEVFEKLNAYIQEHPDYEFYKAYGAYVSVNKDSPDYHYTWKMIDDNVHTDKPVLIADYFGHSACVNGAALDILNYYLGMRWADPEEAADTIKRLLMTDTIQLEKGVTEDYKDVEIINGNIAESPYYNIYLSIPIDKEELKQGILQQQEEVLAKMGYTTLADCGVKSDTIETLQALSELGKEGKLKFKVRAYYMILESDNLTAEQQINKVLDLKAKYDSDYVKIVGVKFFVDGVNEKETCWTKKEYKTNPFESEFPEGYFGINRWDKKWRPLMPNAPEIASIVTLANQNGLSATTHAYGDAAVEYILDQYKAARTIKEYDRNSVSHCAAVDDVDLPRFKELGVVPILAPHWTYRTSDGDEHDKHIYGDGNPTDEGMNYSKLFKIKSFLGEDGKNPIAFHTDGMCPDGMPYMLYTALNRVEPIENHLPARDAREKITLAQALEASTKTPAFLLNEEDNMGSIEIGKCGDFSIYPIDFTDEENFKEENYQVAKKENTPLIATYLNGKIAYDMNNKA